MTEEEELNTGKQIAALLRERALLLAVRDAAMGVRDRLLGAKCADQQWERFVAALKAAEEVEP